MSDFDWIEYADIERKRLRENEGDVDDKPSPTCEEDD